MTDSQITPEIAELNHHWRLLAGFVNEIDIALTLGDATPEQRLGEIAELLVLVRSRMA